MSLSYAMLASDSSDAHADTAGCRLAVNAALVTGPPCSCATSVASLPSGAFCRKPAPCSCTWSHSWKSAVSSTCVEAGAEKAAVEVVVVVLVVLVELELELVLVLVLVDEEMVDEVDDGGADDVVEMSPEVDGSSL